MNNTPLSPATSQREVAEVSQEDVDDLNSDESPWVRRIIALGLLVMLFVILETILIGLFLKRITTQDSLELAAAFVGPVAGVFGTVMGFYFSKPV